jgi:hypothetical protein
MPQYIDSLFGCVFDKGRGEAQRIGLHRQQSDSFHCTPLAVCHVQKGGSAPSSSLTSPFLAGVYKSFTRGQSRTSTPTGLYARLGILQSTMSPRSGKRSRSLDSCDENPSSRRKLETFDTVHSHQATNDGTNTWPSIYDPDLENPTIDPRVLVIQQSEYIPDDSANGTTFPPFNATSTHDGSSYSILAIAASSVEPPAAEGVPDPMSPHATANSNSDNQSINPSVLSEPEPDARGRRRAGWLPLMKGFQVRSRFRSPQFHEPAIKRNVTSFRLRGLEDGASLGLIRELPPSI